MNKSLNKFNMDFCDKYNYPVEIKEHIIEITRLFSSFDNVLSVILMGSTARGEFSYKVSENHLILFSDYEFFLIIKRRFYKEEEIRLQKQLLKYEKNLSFNSPLFHISVGREMVDKIMKLPKIIRNYEMKQNGIVLYGLDLMYQLPDISLENLDYKDLNSLIYKRLRHILFFIPKDMSFYLQDCPEAAILDYILTRNALELTTVFLPYQNILLPSYRERVHYVLDNLRESPSFMQWFHDDIRSVLELSLAVKENKIINVDRKDLYLKIIVLYLDIITFLRRENKLVFNEWPKGRNEIIKLYRMFIEICYKAGIGKAISWLFLKKKETVLNVLLSMHVALKNRLTGEKDEENIVSAYKNLKALYPLRSIKKEGDFVEQWLKLRDVFNILWARWF